MRRESGNMMSGGAYTRRLLIAVPLLAAAWVWLVFVHRTDPSNPARPFRVGYHQSPPHQYVTLDGSPAGPSIEIVNESCRRAGIPIEWVYAPDGPEASFRADKVDLWPLLGDIPERKRLVHVSDPYLSLSFWLVSLESGKLSGPGDPELRLLLHGDTDIDKRLASKAFPGAVRKQVGSSAEVLEHVCLGNVPAGLISGSVTNATNLRKIEACRDAELKFFPLPGGAIGFGVAASRTTPGAARASDAIRSEIGMMANDGSLSTMYFRWYLDPNNEATNLFYLTQAQRRNQHLVLGIGALAALLVLLGWQTLRVRAARSAADRASAVKSEFLANISHEIRTPINAVVGMISLVLDRCSDPESAEQLRDAQDAARSLTAILNDILDLSKIEAGRMSIESVPVELAYVIHETVRMFAAAAREKGLNLRVSISPDCPEWVRGDPVRLRQMIVNLVGNAVKFTQRGEVAVDVSVQREDVLQVVVRDTGIGIPREKLSAIFDSFTQADGSHSRQFGGTGLGLAITKRLVTLMRGRIHAESELGAGSRFVLELPLVACSHPPEEPDSLPAGLVIRDTLHVLVAEDNHVNQKVVAAMLRRQGWTVALAGDGNQVCSVFDREPFDLVLMDVQMPGMDGLEATRSIRRREMNKGLKRTPIIAFTAHASGADQERCTEAGMDAIITKPVELAALIRAISGVMATQAAMAMPGTAV